MRARRPTPILAISMALAVAGTIASPGVDPVKLGGGAVAARSATPVRCDRGGELQARLDSARPGARLVIHGTCRGPFSIRRDVTLSGGGTGARLIGTDGATVPIVRVSSGAHVTIERLTLSGNRGVENQAGAIDNRGHLLLRDTRIARNRAANCGAVRNLGNLRIVDSVIVDNHANVSTGGVCNAATTSIRRSTLFRNSGQDVGHVRSNGTLTIFRSTLHGGMAGNSGASAIQSDGSLRIVGSRIVRNRSTAAGAVEHHGSRLLIRHSVFRENDGFLGAIVATGNVKITDSKLIDNRSEEGAAGLATHGLVMRRSTVRGNRTALFDGGALAISGGGVVGRTWFHDNRAEGTGGGILNHGRLRIYGSEFTRNSAGRGGGVANEGGTVSLSNTIFRANEPDGCAGC